MDSTSNSQVLPQHQQPRRATTLISIPRTKGSTPLAPCTSRQALTTLLTVSRMVTINQVVWCTPINLPVEDKLSPQSPKASHQSAPSKDPDILHRHSPAHQSQLHRQLTSTHTGTCTLTIHRVASHPPVLARLVLLPPLQASQACQSTHVPTI